jgi:hypothetical protein
MVISIDCKRCQQRITAEDEDDLVAQVEAHARDHGGAGGAHTPSREGILAHVHQRHGDLQDRQRSADGLADPA